jgi:hypothetical protein
LLMGLLGEAAPARVCDRSARRQSKAGEMAFGNRRRRGEGDVRQQHSCPKRFTTTNPLPRDDLFPCEQDVATWRRIPSNDGLIFSHTESQVTLTAKPHGEPNQAGDIARLRIADGYSRHRQVFVKNWEASEMD